MSQRTIEVTSQKGSIAAASVQDAHSLANHTYEVFSAGGDLPTTCTLEVDKGDQVVIFDPVTKNAAIKNEASIPVSWQPQPSEFKHVGEILIHLVRSGQQPTTALVTISGSFGSLSSSVLNPTGRGYAAKFACLPPGPLKVRVDYQDGSVANNAAGSGSISLANLEGRRIDIPITPGPPLPPPREMALDLYMQPETTPLQSWLFRHNMIWTANMVLRYGDGLVYVPLTMMVFGGLLFAAMRLKQRK